MVSSSRVRCEEPPEAVRSLLSSITSDDADTRYRARFAAARVGAPAVVPLGELLVDVQRGSIPDANRAREIKTTAHAALERIVHHAGRPGAEKERPAVVAELVRLLEDRIPNSVRREIVHLIAFIGDEKAVPPLAGLLEEDDRHLREQARLALEEIPGRAAVEALVRAAREGVAEEQPNYIFSLGKKRDHSSVGFLLEVAGGDAGPRRFAALEALARLGEKRALAVFERLLASEPPEPTRIFNEYLRLADNLAAQGGTDSAREYRFVLANSPAVHQRERALLRLSAADDVASTPYLLEGLSDESERVREAAIRRLSSLKSPGIDRRLQELYRESPTSARATLLAVLAARVRDAAAGFLAEAAASSDSELKVVALDLLGQLDDPRLAPLLKQVAETGSARVRSTAIRGQLLIAAKLRSNGQTAAALAAYVQVLQLTEDDGQRRAALAGIEQIGDPSALDAVAPFTEHPGCGSEATSTLISLAGKLGDGGQIDEAAELLLRVVGGPFARDLRARAAAELVRLGRDPRAPAREKGFVVDWWCIGSIESSDGKGLETEYFPERVIDLENVQRIGARRFRWQRLAVPSLDGIIDLVPLFRRTTNRIAYAYTEVESPADARVLLKIGSDDGVGCWVNGERVHLNAARRGLTVDEDTVPARLVKGRNRILLKIDNGEATWAFCLRITDPEGKPFPFVPALD